MAFTSWSALRDSLQDALEAHVTEGKTLVGMAVINGRTLQYKNASEITNLIKITYQMEALTNGGNRSTRVSYGRYRRY